MKIPTKYVSELSEAEEKELKERVKHGQNEGERRRGHCILLSNQGYSIDEIAQIYEKDRDTISILINKWEEEKYEALVDKPRSGRPAKLTPEESEAVKKKVIAEPRNIKKVVAEVEQEYQKSISIDIVKRIMQEAGYIWKRIRRSLKSKRDEDKFNTSYQELKEWQEMASRQEIDLYYYDEAGFSLNPVISYAWQLKGTTIEIPATTSIQINALGFLSRDSRLEVFTFTGSITSDIVVECFNLFANSLQRKTLIVIDNAPIHTSQEFDNWIETWEQKGLFLYFLPPYCPELNLIEIFWQRIKYSWLPFSAYLSFANLQACLDEILSNFGSKYQISFT